MESMKLIISIVERGRGAAMLKLYRSRQVVLHLQCPGTGTATSEIMDILGLGSSEKDMVFSLTTAWGAERLLYDLDKDLRGSTGTTGLVFTVPMNGLSNLVANLAAYPLENQKRTNGGEHQMERTENSLIVVACNRGCTDDVMVTAKKAGARGGTVIKARLAGLEEMEKAYDLDLQEEKEIVLIVVPTELRNPLMDALNAEHGLRTPSQSVLCSLPIEQIVRL